MGDKKGEGEWEILAYTNCTTVRRVKKFQNELKWPRSFVIKNIF